MTRVVLRDQRGRLVEIDAPGALTTDLLAQAYASLERVAYSDGGVPTELPRRRAEPDATAVLQRAR
jgi:hypothetical protein